MSSTYRTGSRPPATRPLAARPRTSTGHRRTTARVVGLAVAGVLLLTACGAAGGNDAMESRAADGAAPAVEPRAAGGAGVPSAVEALPGTVDRDAAATPGEPGTDAPRAVRQGAVTVRVTDLDAAAAAARDTAASLRGYVSDESVGLAVDPDQDPDVPWRTTDDMEQHPAGHVPGPGTARLVLRVPSERLDEAMDTLSALGTPVRRWTTSTVVETTMVDLESRIATQTASVDRVRALMAQATTIGEVVTLESELSRREGDLEALQARLQSLSGQVEMATVTVHLVVPGASVEDPGDGGFLDGLRAGWDALVASTRFVLTAGGAVLPFLVVAGVVALPVLALRRRRRTSSSAIPSAQHGPSVPGPATPTPATAAQGTTGRAVTGQGTTEQATTEQATTEQDTTEQGPTGPDGSGTGGGPDRP